MRSTPQGSVTKCDFRRRMRMGGTATSCPFRSWRSSYEHGIVHASEVGAHLSVSQRAGVEGHRAVREEGLDLGDEQVALFEERAHLQLVALQFSPLWSHIVREMRSYSRVYAYLHASGEVD